MAGEKTKAAKEGAELFPITAERLRQLLDYDPASGIFVWKVTRGKALAGRCAGSINTHGYRIIRIEQRDYRAARLAWLFMTGTWPLELVDHADRDRANDAWANLRAASYSENHANKEAHHDSVSGVKGVRPAKTPGRWLAAIQVRGQQRHLGTFASAEEASAAYMAAAREGFGQFARA